MHDEWERLAETCGFSSKDFTEAAVQSFGDSFDGFHLLYGLADKRQRLITGYLAPKKPSKAAGFPLKKEEKIRHPNFGKSFDAKNKEIRTYYPQNGTAISFESSEWYCEGDTDVECAIVIGRAKFLMGCDDAESNVSMDINDDEVGTLCTEFVETSQGEYKPIRATMDYGDVKRMNREWEKLAGSCGLTREEFTEAAITTFGEFWFGGFRLLG
jgi:hypothetical protein